VLYATNLNINYITLEMNYKEIKNNKVIDRDYSKPFEINGIKIKAITKKDEFSFLFIGGNSAYNGALNDGTPIKNRQKGVYIFNFEWLRKIGFFGINFGYRFWNRGKSDSIYDYNEQYYWYYMGANAFYPFKYKNILFFPKIYWNMALNPQLKVYLGNEPTINLGFTRGYGVLLPLYFHYKRFIFSLFYRYNHWHISKSENVNLYLNGNIYQIYEPESITDNQYLGIGVLIRF
jgi:hypothetical protein